MCSMWCFFLTHKIHRRIGSSSSYSVAPKIKKQRRFDFGRKKPCKANILVYSKQFFSGLKSTKAVLISAATKQSVRKLEARHYWLGRLRRFLQFYDLPDAWLWICYRFNLTSLIFIFPFCHLTALQIWFSWISSDKDKHGCIIDSMYSALTQIFQ